MCIALCVLCRCIAGSQVLGIQHEAPVLSCAAVSAHEQRLLAVAETNNGSFISVIDSARDADTVAMLMVTSLSFVNPIVKLVGFVSIAFISEAFLSNFIGNHSLLCG